VRSGNWTGLSWRPCCDDVMPRSHHCEEQRRRTPETIGMCVQYHDERDVSMLDRKLGRARILRGSREAIREFVRFKAARENGDPGALVEPASDYRRSDVRSPVPHHGRIVPPQPTRSDSISRAAITTVDKARSDLASAPSVWIKRREHKHVNVSGHKSPFIPPAFAYDARSRVQNTWATFAERWSRTAESGRKRDGHEHGLA